MSEANFRMVKCQTLANSKHDCAFTSDRNFQVKLSTTSTYNVLYKYNAYYVLRSKPYSPTSPSLFGGRPRATALGCSVFFGVLLGQVREGARSSSTTAPLAACAPLPWAPEREVALHVSGLRSLDHYDCG